MIRLRDQKSSTLADECLEAFTQRSLPEVIVSDSGTNFTSQDFGAFCKRFGISQEFSSPHHHSANGQVERVIADIKKAMSRSADVNEFHVALLMMRSTPLGPGLPSPMQLSAVIKPRTLLPSVTLATPNDQVLEMLAKRQERDVERRENSNARMDTSFAIGEAIYVQACDDGPWAHATIVRAHEGHHNRKYTVKLTESQREIVRNIVHLRHTAISEPTSALDRYEMKESEESRLMRLMQLRARSTPAPTEEIIPATSKQTVQDASTLGVNDVPSGTPAPLTVPIAPSIAATPNIATPAVPAAVVVSQPLRQSTRARKAPDRLIVSK